MSTSCWIVVGGLDLGESDRLVRFLSAEEGRVSLVARRARASRRRFAGLLDLGTRVRIQQRRGQGELKSLVAADRVGGAVRARAELERIALLAWGCELCAALAPEGQAAPKLHRLLEVWLDLLEGDATPGIASRLALEGKALTFVGLAPALVRCSRTRQALDGVVRFVAESGGAQVGAGSGQRVDATELKQLDLLRRTPLLQTPTLPAPAGGVRWLLADFAEHQLGRRLRSRAMLDELGC